MNQRKRNHLRLRITSLLQRHWNARLESIHRDRCFLQVAFVIKGVGGHDALVAGFVQFGTDLG